jgi:type IV pilus assembly protein PilE
MYSVSTPFRSRRSSGFSLMELLCAMAIVAILVAIALPSFQSSVLKARRADALASVMQLQAAQERHRSGHVAYGNLRALGMPARSAQGHYQMSVSDEGASGYRIIAQADGAQDADTACRYLQLRMVGMDQSRASGPTALVGNSADENRRCWAM